MKDATKFAAPQYSTWNELDQKSFRVWLYNLLTTNVVSVTFTKRDGTERLMRCTLKSDQLPAVDRRDERQVSDTAISVWDTEKDAWRSFRFANVTSISFTLGE